MPAETCSLIISTFNNPTALSCCLKSVVGQSVLPEEVIIADDGSDERTANLIRDINKNFPIPIIHLWQSDEGYQLAKIRNKAFLKAKSELLIQIDGDVILHPDFINDHKRMAEPGTFMSGTRTLVDKPLSEQIVNGQFPISKIGSEKNHFIKKYNSWYSKLLSRLNYFLQRGKSNYKHVLGCNMSFWKSDLEKVNGYNESFKGWGKEDNDLAIRLMNAGVQLRFIKFAGILYHLHHPVCDLSRVAINEKLLQKSVQEKITYVKEGMSLHE